MKRKIYDKLLDWKANGNKPLIILGARQVGKTYIIKEFCKNEFKKYNYISLKTKVEVVDLYNRNINSDDKYKLLCTMLNQDLEEDDTCLFIDEIQESENLISDLKYFCEEHPNAKVVCAGSLLGIKLKKLKTSFPVGKVDIEYLYPMNFEEFLIGIKQEFLIEQIKEYYNNSKEFPLHNTALEYYKLYLISGGMPESIQEMIDCNNDISKFKGNAKKKIVNAYFDDMAQYVESNTERIKINELYKSIPYQLKNSTKKFQFSGINADARSRDYKLSLEWLLANSIVLKSMVVSVPTAPLPYYCNDSVYKLYLNDVGITTNRLGLRNYEIMLYNVGEVLGPVAENYVAQEFVSNEIELCYWKSDRDAEVDFLLHTEEGIIPIEVKAGENTQSKSLKVYMENFNPPYAIRISAKNFGYDKKTKIKSVPLYATFCIEES